MSERLWHGLGSDVALQELQADQQHGLSSKEALARRAHHGPNVLAESKAISLWHLLMEQFQDFMVLVLLGATAISLLLGEIGDGLTIVAIVVVNACLGFLQEFRAEKSMEKLRELSSPVASVRRDGHELRVAAEEVVPGDVLLLEAGDRPVADARLLKVVSLECEEAALTGEADPVVKQTAALEERPMPAADQVNMVFRGTTVTRGRGEAVVVQTGMGTQMGAIAKLIADPQSEPTPLQRRLEGLGKILVLGCILICAVVVLTGVLRGEGLYRMFLTGVSLAVAAIPEGLPAIVTIALAVGVQRMIKRRAVVRRLPAVETLGCATIICSDKTGSSDYIN